MKYLKKLPLLLLKHKFSISIMYLNNNIMKHIIWNSSFLIQMKNIQASFISRSLLNYVSKLNSQIKIPHKRLHVLCSHWHVSVFAYIFVEMRTLGRLEEYSDWSLCRA